VSVCASILVAGLGGRCPREATLLVRAMDNIFGTHRACSYARSSLRALAAMLFAGNDLGRLPPCHAAPRCPVAAPQRSR
jgi:hypothetical protein